MTFETGNNPTVRSKEPAANSGSIWRWLLFPTIAVVLLVGAKELELQHRLKAGLDWIAQLGPWGPILFIGLYMVATVLFIPASVLTLGAGAIFGVLWGSVYVSIGSTLGATAAFLIGRYLARDGIARRIEGNERFASIDKTVVKEGWKIVGLTRLSPMFPFTLLNYAFGLTRIKLSDYILASWMGMMPGTVMYVSLGSLAQAATRQRMRTTAEWVLYGIGLLATVLVTLLVTRIARQALTRKIDE